MWLVTGGAGFIGSHVLKRWSAQGEGQLALCDTLGHGSQWQYLRQVGLEAIVLPEQMPDFLAQRGRELEGILHLGAVSDTRATDGDHVVRTNIQLSQKLWQFCARFHIPFLWASSAATYGGGEQGFSDAPDQTPNLRPLNLYGWSKQAFDMWAVEQARSGASVPPFWAGFRFFNVYGAHEKHKGGQRSVASVWYDHLVVEGGREARLFRATRPGMGDGEQKRDFVFVEDCVDVISWFRARSQTPDPGVLCGIWNVGTGQARTFNDLAAVLLQALGRPPAIAYVDMPEGLAACYQDYTCADLTRLRAAGYNQPMTPLEVGIPAFVKSRQDMDRP